MKTVIANWKANPSTLAEAQELFGAEVSEAAKYNNVQTIICPPFIYLEELSKKLETGNWKLETVSLGAQDIFWEKSGPYTGEVSVDMLKEFGITHALVGHSDRRYKMGETDEVINKKVKAVLKADIVPILLVGEKDRGGDKEAILEKQLSADLDSLTAEEVSRVLIAYEPVWAISTTPGAQADTPESTLEAMNIISNFLYVNCKLETKNFLYGGSVTEKNVADFLSHPEISGAVIGGASLRKDEFANILRIVSEIE